MTTFIGEYIAKADDKGRLVFPSAFKAVMPVDGDTRFVLKKDIFEDCLEMYTFEEWERQSSEVKTRLNFFNREHAAFWREYMRDRAVVEPDGIPPIDVNKEVLFSRNHYTIEICAKEKFQASSISNEEYIALAGKLSQ